MLSFARPNECSFRTKLGEFARLRSLASECRLTRPEKGFPLISTTATFASRSYKRCCPITASEASQFFFIPAHISFPLPLIPLPPRDFVIFPFIIIDFHRSIAYKLKNNLFQPRYNKKLRSAESKGMFFLRFSI